MVRKQKPTRRKPEVITFTGLTRDQLDKLEKADRKTGRFRCYICKRLEGAEGVILDSKGATHFAPIEIRKVHHEFGNGSLAAYHICLECAMLLWNPKWK